MKDQEFQELATAYLRGYRASPRKVRLVADLIRGKTVHDAVNILKFTDKKVAPILLKLLDSAVANAQVKALEVDDLVVRRIMVGVAPTLKRFIPRAKGSASGIKKRSSHIAIGVGY